MTVLSICLFCRPHLGRWLHAAEPHAQSLALGVAHAPGWRAWLHVPSIPGLLPALETSCEHAVHIDHSLLPCPVIEETGIIGCDMCWGHPADLVRERREVHRQTSARHTGSEVVVVHTDKWRQHCSLKT